MPAYDPLNVDTSRPPQTVRLTVHDAERARDLPVKLYLPDTTNAAPVILFSHGLGGSCENSPYLGTHWAARGYTVVFIQHPGSDESVWRDPSPAERMHALRQAASAQNFKLRVKDVPVTIDQLTRWNAQTGHPLFNRLDLTRIGMSGHSFGAVTTQAVSGETFAFGLAGYTDPRICAALALSPSPPRIGRTQRVFGSVKIPWMLMTGTRDDSPIGDIDAAARLTVFPALPPGGKYELVLDNAEHSAFGDRPLPGDKTPRNPNHHRAILALSTAFWDAYLRNDPAAKMWLDSDRARAVLEPKDRWQRK